LPLNLRAGHQALVTKVAAGLDLQGIVSDSKTYGTAGAIFGILTWAIAIGAVIIPGAVAGFVWEDQRNCSNRSQEQ